MILLGLAMLVMVLCFLGLVLIYSHLNIIIKIGAILSTIILVAMQSFLIYYVKGTATDIQMPNEFLAIATVIKEPNEKTNDKGSIFYLLIDTPNNKSDPQLYVIPYSKESHKQGNEIQERINESEGPVWVSMKTKSNDDSVEGRILKQILNNLGSGSGLFPHHEDYYVELNNQKNTIQQK